MTDIRQSIAARYCSRGGIRYIGLGFYWAWLFIAFYTSVLLPTSSSASESMSGIWNWAAWAHAVTLIACALLARQLQPYALRRCSIALASVGTCVGTLLIPLGSALEPISSAAMACAASGALITGATTAWLVLSWGVLYSRRGARFSLFGIIASYLLGIVLYFLVQLMSESIAIATTALLPACSGMLLRAASAIAPATTGHDAESEAGSPSASEPDCAKVPFAPRVILPLAAVLLYALCGEVLRGFATAPGGRATLDGMGSLYLLGSAAGLVVMGGIIALIPSFTHRRPSEMPGIRATLLIMAAGFLATTLTSASFFFAYAVFGAAFQCFRALVWMYSADVTERTGAMAFSVFGATQGCAALAVVLGVPIAESLSQAVSLGAAQWSTIASIGLFLIFLLCRDRHQSEKPRDGLGPHAQRSGPGRAAPRPLLSTRAQRGGFRLLLPAEHVRPHRTGVRSRIAFGEGSQPTLHPRRAPYRSGNGPNPPFPHLPKAWRPLASRIPRCD